jgi:tRNA-specific 2-thiouridylase
VVVKNKKELLKKEFLVKSLNLTTADRPKFPFAAMVKTRYRQKETRARVFETIRPGIYKIVLKKAQKAITPGQSTVFYKGKELIGGGVII